MSKLQERFFILTPTPTPDPQVYHDAEGKPMKWSGRFPIPAIGQRIYITMNRIGWATVKGYFESCGFVGVMTLAENPPDWLKKQRKRTQNDLTKPHWLREGIGCEFGLEISLTKPGVK